MEEDSIYFEGRREADRHKWIESQKSGHDLGVWAVNDWYSRYWPIFCRLKCLEHLAGIRSWAEFEPEAFGLVGRHLRDEDLLLEMILDRAMTGLENLSILLWAQDWGLPMKRVLYILEQLNLNQAQMMPTQAPLTPDGPPRFARPGTIPPG
ncbi:MAG: hypothetical protein ACKV0T_31525 [Planctomycetales bacterium]